MDPTQTANHEDRLPRGDRNSSPKGTVTESCLGAAVDTFGKEGNIMDPRNQGGCLGEKKWSVVVCLLTIEIIWWFCHCGTVIVCK